MIEAVIVRENGRIVSFYGAGHAGYAEIGSDIVCAAVSTVMQQTALGIIDYLKLDVKPTVKNGFLSINLKNVDNNGREAEVDALTESMYLMLVQIAEQYPKYVKLTVKEGK